MVNSVRLVIYSLILQYGGKHKDRKIAGIIQKDLADILQRAAIDGGLKGTIISVSKVSVTTDLSIAKVYVSIFPNKGAKELLNGIKESQVTIRHELAQRTRHQLRRVPELNFIWMIPWNTSKGLKIIERRRKSYRE